MSHKILVTGGTGYIGSHTVVELQESGYKVIIVDDLSNSNINVLDNIEKITGVKPAFEKFNLVDSERTEDFFRRNVGIEAIIHFAASKAVGESVEKPLLYYRNNLVSMINLLECQIKFDVPNIVFSSSCTVYGQPNILPVTEETPRQDSESPYGNTKRVNEDILRDSIAANPQLTGISLRYFNPIGAHSSALIGELPSGIPNNLVPFITQTAAGIRGELKVFGDDYNTSDGSAIRDYINVVDLAKAHVVAIRRLLKGKNKTNYEVFNLGTGKGLSVLEIINKFEKATGAKLKYKIVPRRTGDIEKIWADTNLANKELGWKAEKELEETLLSAWNWEKRVREIK
ncbi:MAG: UDP-glucose 4-epimerase GalE [Prolixibacteraceae bacterium]|jgi:UDP-glucose 4-epimerase|nr:UDP-glucose 4-epimerase GalE [Prolixibacteraceae bacterium]MBT6005865.1 UDP-glucose 4-epimerase GalE [Prolixibacteraceae bacterium]MBT6763861.1 UDP-glucose 4-epimerase GalE [Prolixibacteraceae bacterium]MBT6997099.1 UDP-glucose 4-epimerase GalE [Prolixibacteraceae bacterium]MBT7393368.1 UDP-glucose 4-epimerase GalE [Prolixibacteraceae bacterium]